MSILKRHGPRIGTVAASVVVLYIGAVIAVSSFSLLDAIFHAFVHPLVALSVTAVIAPALWLSRIATMGEAMLWVIAPAAIVGLVASQMHEEMLTLFAILATVIGGCVFAYFALPVRRVAARGRCARCDYILAKGTGPVCSECGYSIEVHAAMLRRCAQRKPWLLAALCIWTIAIGAFCYPRTVPPMWRVEQIVESGALNGLTVAEANAWLGTDVEEHAADGTHDAELRQFHGFFFAWVEFDVKDGRLVEARLMFD